MPTFSKRHYELVAKALAKSKPQIVNKMASGGLSTTIAAENARDEQWKKDVETLAEAFSDDNPSFNEERFTTAVMDLGREPR